MPREDVDGGSSRRRRLAQIRAFGDRQCHTGTARFYTDFSLLTSDVEMGEDVHKVFLQLTSLGSVLPMKRLLHAPFTLKSTLLELIRGEEEAARNGRPAFIRAKLNLLSHPGAIAALYKASQAGVCRD